MIMEKHFTTLNVPGFPDGHPLTLRAAFDFAAGRHNEELQLMGHLKLHGGIDLVALIPATPENFEKHVRIQDMEPMDHHAVPRGF